MQKKMCIVALLIRAFEFRKELKMRTRLAAQRVGKEYMEKYSRAVQLMKDLPPEDPRNFMQPANVHCAYCNGAYYMGNTDKEFRVHGGWFFLPWHRWYLYFYERILAKLLEDDTFALPYWNWDLDEGMTIPPMYMDKTLCLFNEKRNPNHANAFVDLGFSQSAEWLWTDEDLIRKNYRIMYKQIVVLGSSTRTFHGEAIREYSETCTCGSGTLEHEPHNTLHDWTGSVVTHHGKVLTNGGRCPSQACVDTTDKQWPRPGPLPCPCPCPCPTKTCSGEDMGILYSAARDPIFFAHHANADRIWTIWQTELEGKDYDDPDLLDTKFYFYDENACLVEVRAGDAFDPEKLRYKYEYSRTPWLRRIPIVPPTVPTIVPPTDSMASWSALPPIEPSIVPPIVPTLNRTFSNPVKIHVARNIASGSSNELLVIEGIRVQRNMTVKFDVFVQLDDCRVYTRYVDTLPPEYAGTFVELPRGAINDVVSGCEQSSMRVVISGVLRDLGVGEDEESIVVTLIPKVNLQQPIRISAVRMELE